MRLFLMILDDMREYWNTNKYYFFPDAKKGVVDEKKLLGVAIENEADNCIALAPKCYTLFNNDDSNNKVRFKGVRKEQNKHLNTSSFIDVVMNNSIVKGRNCNLQLKNNVMSSVLIEKNALTSVHTKMIVLSNGCCCPYLYAPITMRFTQQSKCLYMLQGLFLLTHLFFVCNKRER